MRQCPPPEPVETGTERANAARMYDDPGRPAGRRVEPGGRGRRVVSRPVHNVDEAGRDELEVAQQRPRIPARSRWGLGGGPA